MSARICQRGTKSQQMCFLMTQRPSTWKKVTLNPSPAPSHCSPVNSTADAKCTLKWSLSRVQHGFHFSMSAIPHLKFILHKSISVVELNLRTKSSYLGVERPARIHVIWKQKKSKLYFRFRPLRGAQRSEMVI